MSSETQAIATPPTRPASSSVDSESVAHDFEAFQAKTLPDLSRIFQRETHASLLFDDHPDGKC
ncbi:hypothetical protein OAF30_01000, partial [Flavobacteriales bacterium]|nr:hypothetical protein [Flavobacteriales bacterium]